jgi:hypothetical protein
MTSFQATEKSIMKLKAFGFAAVLAAAWTAPVGFAQPAPSPAGAASCPADGFSGGFSKGCPQKQFANPADISAMMAALPEKPYATPQSLRHVLVLCRAVGWVHTSIPLAAKMVEYLGDKTGAWMTTITYDAAAITPENLKQYDAVFLDNTTGAFLDDPNDKAVSDLRRQALLDFVKGGKGLAGIHAATDSYHTNGPAPRRRVARVQRSHGRFLQIPLGVPYLDPGQGGRSPEPLNRDVSAPRLRYRRRDLHVCSRLIQPKAGTCTHQRQLRQNERGRQSQGAGRGQAYGRRLRVELHSARGQWARFL